MTVNRQYREVAERMAKAGFPVESHKHDNRSENQKLFDSIHAKFKKKDS